MKVKLAGAAFAAALGLSASGAQASVLLYSASGVISSDAVSLVNASVAIPAGGYTQLTPIDPLTDPFRGSIPAPVETTPSFSPPMPPRLSTL